MINGIYIRWYLRKRCARKELYLLVELFKAVDCSHKLDFSLSKRRIFIKWGATRSELPSNISTKG